MIYSDKGELLVESALAEIILKLNINIRHLWYLIESVNRPEFI